MDDATLGGHAAVFDEWTDIGGMFLERIAPGAFEGRLGDDVPFLVNHDGIPLARTSAGTMDLALDERGLVMSARISGKSPLAQDVLVAIERGDLSKMSFAFTVAKEEWDETGEIPRRSILQIGRLYDVAVVTDPAYGGTDIGFRSLEDFRAERRAKTDMKERRAGQGLAVTPGGDPRPAPSNSHGARARSMRMRVGLFGLS